MVFEVDNTTERLIHALQDSIESTIATLEDGQRELRALIDTVKSTCEDSATAEQADVILKRLSEQQKAAATAQQIMGIEAAMETSRRLTEQELDKLAGIEESLAGSSQAEADRLRSLQELSDRLGELAADLVGRLEPLASSAARAAKTAEENQAALAAITAYLSLPGYKRFFKGMEAPTHEITS